MNVYAFFHTTLPGALLAALLYGALYVPRRRRLARMGLTGSGGRELLLALFMMYSGAMAMLTLFPLDFDLLDVLRHGYDGPFFRPGEMSWQVMRTLRYDRLIFWGNVVLFVPFGFVPAVLWRGSRWYRALAFAVGITAFIECWQLQIGRTFDVDDLLLNAVGAMLGWLLWLLLKKPLLCCEEL
ncbi:MAG: VanZ family protein [Ruminococcaceae bacterium]|jgi:glycopeptide antibiotics resistance protein|nr:VanZ family protein [Oscillospiraceae bacterium]